MANETQGTKHTAGPWSSHEGTSPHYQGQVYNEATGATIAITYSDEDGANAKLIAQAPAMAAALEHCIKALRNRKGYTTTDRAQIAVEHARAVLSDAGVLA